MKKTIITALVLFTGAFYTTASAVVKDNKKKKKNKTEQVVNLKTAIDSVSYAAGINLTNDLNSFLNLEFGVDSSRYNKVLEGYLDAVNKGNDLDFKAYSAGIQVANMVANRFLPTIKKDFKTDNDSINIDIFHKGFAAGLSKDSTIFAPSKANEYIKDIKKQLDAKKIEVAQLQEKAFLAENATKPGVITLPSGLQYKVITEGNGAVAGLNDNVTVKYEGRLINGNVFDSSYKRNPQTSVFKPTQVIKGWTEALTLMPEGSKWELYIPYSLAYGAREAGSIPAYSTLIFTVELVKVEKEEVKSEVEEIKPAAKETKKANNKKAKTVMKK